MSLLQAGLSRRSPVPPPAPLPAPLDRLQGRPSGPVAEGIVVEHRFHESLQTPGGNGLSDPVRDGRSSQG